MRYGTCLFKLGRACQELGRYPEAAPYLDQAQEIYQQLRLPAQTQLARTVRSH
jgi:tetratricopeptide (TPR) repeat protein